MSRARQKGFTLLEVMFASTAGLIVLVPAVAMMFRMFSWYDEIQSQFALNQHARETFDLISYGSRTTSNGNDGTKNIYGFRGRKSAPNSTLRNQYRLRYSSNGATLTTDTFASMSVSCTGTGVPLPDCSSSSTKTVSGWMGDDATINTSSRDVAARTAEVTITITDPFEAQRLTASSAASQTYRTVLTLNRDEDDP